MLLSVCKCVLKASLKSDASSMQLSAAFYILHMSSASPILARAATNVFLSRGMSHCGYAV